VDIVVLDSRCSWKERQRYVGSWKAAGEQRDRVGRIINSEIALVPGTGRMFPRWCG
jgi:hypothetical protein